MLFNRDKIDIDVLFIQPTNYCGNNCKECYLKKRKFAAQVPLEEEIELFKKFYNKEGVSTNQIVISVDKLPISSNEKKFLLSYLKSILSLLVPSNKLNPSVSLTIDSIPTYLDYRENIKTGWENLTRISFSSFFPEEEKTLKEIKKLGVKTNLNYKISNNTIVNSTIQDLLLKQNYFDSLYLIMEKSPISKTNNDDPLNIINKIDQIYKSLSQAIKNKITLDYCILSRKEFLKTGNYCSANITRFQVWPDGSVSGCPYAKESNTKNALASLDILSNIVESKKVYDFEKCYLCRREC